MKFSIGDPVFVISNNEEAVITEFIGNDMACVKAGSSVYHAYLSDLEHPYLRWFMNKKKEQAPIKFGDQILTDKTFKRTQSLPDGLYLGFMPVFEWDGIDDKVTKVKVYLFNETNHHLDISYSCVHKNNLLFQHQAELRPLNEFYMHDLDFELISTNPEFLFQCQDKDDKKLYAEFEVGLKPKKLFMLMDKLRHENKPVFHLLVFDHLKPLPKQEVFVSSYRTSSDTSNTPVFFDFEKAKKQQIYELDLHIEKLITHWEQLSGSAILQIQLIECQKALELAVSTHQSRLIIIHGMGSGRLKKEIHLLINQTKGVYKFVSDYDVRYGYGATEVFFQP